MKVVNKIHKDCPCGKGLVLPPCRDRIKHCSRECYYKYGINTKGVKNGMWNGADVGYCGVHDWVHSRMGKAKDGECFKHDETCKGRLEWSNKSQKYLRKVVDWWILCQSHHRRYDFKTGGIIKVGRPFKKGNIPWNKKKK